jgi:N-acetylmuramoyl-L-alanine amidase
MLRLSATLLVACGSFAALVGVALIFAGPAFPIGHQRHAATQAALRPAGRDSHRVGQDGDTAGAPAGNAAGAIDPALFYPGACVAFDPTTPPGGDKNETVFLDAGHGGIDPGAVGSTESGAQVDESTVNLAVELDAAAILRAEGYRVVVSRTQDTTVARLTPADLSDGLLSVQGVVDDLADRDLCANLAGADVLVGIYMDSGSPGNAGSVTGYDADRPFSAANLRLATLLQDDVLGALDAQGYAIPDEGVMPDTVLGSALDSAALAYGHLILLGPAKAGYFTTPSLMPGALIEPLFLTDPFEGSIAASAEGQQVIAAAVAEAINQYFGWSSPHRPDI